ncbi:MAG: hypothetical protein Q8M95_13935 [Candidatus Methanoperedens sp.]|nr:hypothetical protein [Candidatus Methanoperedens sp.]
MLGREKSLPSFFFRIFSVDREEHIKSSDEFFDKEIELIQSIRHYKARQSIRNVAGLSKDEVGENG